MTQYVLLATALEIDAVLITTDRRHYKKATPHGHLMLQERLAP